jgi:hypothetical protein
MAFKLDDKVKVVALNRPTDDRFVMSFYDPPQTPQVGDVGIVVEIPFPDQIIVDCLDDSGAVRWQSDFDLDELTAA